MRVAIDARVSETGSAVPVIAPLRSILVELRESDKNPSCGAILRDIWMSLSFGKRTRRACSRWRTSAWVTRTKL